jgi:CheY-like chemotaxis protein
VIESASTLRDVAAETIYEAAIGSEGATPETEIVADSAASTERAVQTVSAVTRQSAAPSDRAIAERAGVMGRGAVDRAVTAGDTAVLAHAAVTAHAIVTNAAHRERAVVDDAPRAADIGEGIPTADAALRATAPETAAAPRRFLVVDDNRDAVASLDALLKLHGNETCTAHDGFEAIAAAETFEPDIVLLDLGLPNLNGYEACRRIRERIRQQKHGKQPLIIAMTGWGQPEDRRLSNFAGFDHHLVKPVAYEALMQLLG